MYGGGVGKQENSKFPFLWDLTTPELERILSNEDALNDLVKNNEEVRSVQLQRETLLATNRSLAEHNLSREPRLRSGKGRLASLYTQSTKLRSQYERDKQQLDAMASQNSLDTILVMLRSAAGSCEDDAERIADNFLEGNLGAKTFIEQYIAKRKEAHIRRINAEKMMEIRNQKQTQQQVCPPSAQSYTPFAYGSGHNTPYPVGSGYMPMPSL
ncbi:vacuolar protein sorting-associated protein 37B-like [Saccoglossus kowalevskii]|uniref:Vacuolar protein sorting-associated protein 37B-like n=1 Tax=Saccoglossus kowalevskii TaxID=10224 RepID=A0ABM0GVV1_SACKO|nr:PREDICTED: vacuolar protein sorting-associated protein 37B-like [Saccoglossus kowalevskii]